MAFPTFHPEFIAPVVLILASWTGLIGKNAFWFLAAGMGVNLALLVSLALGTVSQISRELNLKILTI